MINEQKKLKKWFIKISFLRKKITLHFSIIIIIIIVIIC
jgi:hypothetical protein